MDAVIMAGGKGSRLADVSPDIPKPLVRINGIPVLQHQLEKLRQAGIDRIIVVIHYLGEQIKSYFGDGHNFGIHLVYYEEPAPLGTAGALGDLETELSPDFFLLNADLIFDIDFGRMVAFHRAHRALGTLATHANDHPFDSDLLVVNGERRVTAMVLKNQKRSGSDPNCVNSGISLFRREIIRYVAKGQKQSLESDVLAKAIREAQPIYAYPTTEYIKDMGTPGRLHQVRKDVQQGIVAHRNLVYKQKAVFLDRDGTVNRYVGLLTEMEQLEIDPPVYEALRKLNHSEFITIIITNQPAVARNLCTIRDVDRIHNKLQSLLGEQGVYVDDIFFCPHHPDKGYPEENKAYKIACNCRKPDIGLIMAAAAQYHIDPGESFFIGDSTADIQTGYNAGMKTILLATGLGGNDGKYDARPDYRARDLLEAVEIVLKVHESNE